jgi:photosystem II stability/assembly factor-like uncharacterized protein
VLALGGGTAWAYDGTDILRSTDSGASWQVVFPTWPQKPTALQVTGAFFLTSKDAWALTDHQWPAPPGVTTVWQTTDGGATWLKGLSMPDVERSDYGSPLQQFIFVDTKHGYALSDDLSLYATSYGGMNWHEVQNAHLPWDSGEVPRSYGLGCSAQDLFSLSVVSAKVLLITGAGCPTSTPEAWRSIDGGHSWASVALPAPRGGWAAAEAWAYPGPSHAFQAEVPAPEPQRGATVLSTRFFSNGAGVMALTTRPGDLVVYTSRDSGATWRLTSSLSTGSLSRPAGFAASSPSDWELSAPSGLYSTTDSGEHWGLQRSGLSLPPMTDISFASGRFGAGLSGAMGDGGFRTTDGGKSWQRLSFPGNGDIDAQEPFSTVDFVTASQGWVAGAGGVEATTDGGRDWSAQLETASPVVELSFADVDHGWALTSDQLFSTSDGGQRWSVLPAIDLGAFAWVQFVSTTFGVAMVCGTAGNRVLATYDAGITWGRLAVPNADEMACEPSDVSPGAAASLCFGTPDVGWALRANTATGGAVMERTGDGGLRWSAVAFLEPTPDDLACQGTAQAWVGFFWMENMGLSGDLAGTADGGRTWSIGKFGRSPFNTPRMRATDGSPIRALGTAKGSSRGIWEPVDAILITGPGDVVEVWDNEGPGCQGDGLVTTQDGGADWTDAPATRTSAVGCPQTGLPFLQTSGLPSVSFAGPENGFALGPALAAKSEAANGPGPPTMALIATTNGGQSWRLLSRFT